MKHRGQHAHGGRKQHCDAARHGADDKRDVTRSRNAQQNCGKDAVIQGGLRAQEGKLMLEGSMGFNGLSLPPDGDHRGKDCHGDNAQ